MLQIPLNAATQLEDFGLRTVGMSFAQETLQEYGRSFATHASGTIGKDVSAPGQLFGLFHQDLGQFGKLARIRQYRLGLGRAEVPYIRFITLLVTM